MSRIAAIHQPNFFPWLGWFSKIARSDVFVILDDVQHQKTGSNWSNRVRLLVSGEGRWVTAPIRRPSHGAVTLDGARWAEGPWRAKLLRSIQLNYRKSPHFRDMFALLEPLVLDPESSLVAYNVRATTAIAKILGLRTDWKFASAHGISSTANQRLIELVHASGCDTYLAGGGAQGYQDEGQFRAAGVELKYQSFVHPCYPQQGLGSFIPGLSVIDALMNCGPERTRELILS